MKKIKLYTYWRENKLECCCPEQNRCRKERGCELEEFLYDEYSGVKDCMKSRSYKRGKNGAIVQK